MLIKINSEKQSLIKANHENKIEIASEKIQPYYIAFDENKRLIEAYKEIYNKPNPQQSSCFFANKNREKQKPVEKDLSVEEAIKYSLVDFMHP